MTSDPRHDLPMLARVAGKEHGHNSLAGIALRHSGYSANNLRTRRAPLAACPIPAEQGR